MIKIIENNETIDNEIKVAKTFNEYFVNTVENTYRKGKYNFYRKQFESSENSFLKKIQKSL